MAENESIKITQLPSATVTQDGDYLVFSTATNTFKIKVKDFMVQFTQSINKSIANEETSRKTADNLLQENIDDEVTNREDADTNITNDLDTLTTNFNELKISFEALGLCVIDGKVCQKVNVNE